VQKIRMNGQIRSMMQTIQTKLKNYGYQFHLSQKWQSLFLRTKKTENKYTELNW
jgi:hypothetical protein